MLEDNHKYALLRYVLNEEKQSYRLNPTPSGRETIEKETKYKKKVNEIVKQIAEEEGFDYENS